MDALSIQKGGSANETDHCQSERSTDICPHHAAVLRECRWFIQSLVQQHHEHGHVADSGLPADLSDRGAAVEHRGGIQGQSVALSSSGVTEGLFLILTICLWHHIE